MSNSQESGLLDSRIPPNWLNKALVYSVLQFLREQNYEETAHCLEKESGFFFDMRYFEEIVTNGELDEAEQYLSGFSKFDDNTESIKIYFEIWKQKYFEALDRHDHQEAVEMFLKDLKKFSHLNDEMVKEISQLLALGAKRSELVSKYGDTKSARAIMLTEVKKLTEANPVFCNMLPHPSFENLSLRNFFYESFALQYSTSHDAKQSPVPQQTVSAGPLCRTAPNALASNNAVSVPSLQKRPRTSSTDNPAMDYQTSDFPTVLKRNRGSEISSDKMADVNPRTAGEFQKSKTLKPTKINVACSLLLPDTLEPDEVVGLIYTNSGGSILALTQKGIHKLWKWQRNEQNVSGNATVTVPPLLYKPSSGILMINDKASLEDSVPCFAVSKNDYYAVSASGGKISLFNMITFKTMATFMPPPPAATYLAFHPQANNIVAIGMEDSTIQIYNVRSNEVQRKIEGHQKRVTGLAFSNVLNVLVSSGADSQLCVWSLDGWKQVAGMFLQIPEGCVPTRLGQTRVQVHQDEIVLLAVHETQIATFELPQLKRLERFEAQESDSGITDAKFSCDGQLIYASFQNSTVHILNASQFESRYVLYPTEKIFSTPSMKVYPTVVATHPSNPNQFAFGLTDGRVIVMEPTEASESEGPSTRSAGGSDQQPSWPV